MKALSSWVLSLTLCCAVFAAPNPNKTIPELTLKDGRTLKNVTLVNISGDPVMAKWQGGRGTIAVSNFPAEWMGVLTPRKAPTEEEKQAALAAAAKRRAKIEAAQAEERERLAENGQKAKAEMDAQIASMERAERIKAAIEKKTIVIGMSREEATSAWGEPHKKNISGGKYGSHEQWIYYHLRGPEQRVAATYVYFSDGELTSWQDESR